MDEQNTSLWDKEWKDGDEITAECLNQIEEVFSSKDQINYIFTTDDPPTGQQCIDLLNLGILPTIFISQSNKIVMEKIIGYQYDATAQEYIFVTLISSARIQGQSLENKLQININIDG